MEKIDIEKSQFKLVNSTMEGHKEVEVVFNYKGKVYKYFIFIKEGKDINYLEKAKKQFEIDLKSGKVKKVFKSIHNNYHPLLVSAISAIAVVAIGCGALFTYKALTRTPAIHSVFFDSNGGSHIDTIKVNDKEKMEQPANPTKAGYTFSGWYVSPEFEGERYNFNTPVETDLVLYANWGDANIYNITYNNLQGSETTNPKTYNVTTDTITLTDPTDRGYKFTGWHKDSETGDKITSIPKGSTGDITLYATWETTPTKYDITYLNLLDSTTGNPKNYDVTTDTITLTDPTDRGYKFTGWRKDRIDGDEIREIKKGSVGNMTLYATWQNAPTTYNISYENLDVGAGAQTDNPTTYKVTSDAITLTDPTDPGYEFTGWHKGSTIGEKVTEIEAGSTGDITLYASWKETPTTYNISYENLGGTTTANPLTYNVTSDTITLTDPTGDRGYKFAGWHKGSVAGPAITSITKGSVGDLAIYATWETAPTAYTITYNNLQGSTHTNPESYNVTTDTIYLSNPTDSGYAFKGWLLGGAEGTPITKIDRGTVGNLILYATWEETPTIYHITYSNLLDSTHTNPESYNVTTDTITLTNPTDRGYGFTGWRKGSAAGDVITTIPQGSFGNLDLYASWSDTPTTYTVSYENLKGTTHTNPESYNVTTSTIILSNPTDSGYKFTGWRVGSTTGDPIARIPQGSTGNLTLYATWETTPTVYTITYANLQGTTTDNPTTYTVENGDITLHDPKEDRGYEFANWRENDAEGEVVTKISHGSVGNKTLWAEWSTTPTVYDIHYENLQGSTTTNPESYNVTTDTITLTDPTDHGYAFTGWRKNDATGDVVTTIPQGSIGDITLWATWSETPTTYTITYNNLKGGTTTNPTSYKVTSDTITLTDPTGVAGYTFTGWRKGSAAGDVITTIPQGSFGNLDIYASWSDPIQYTIGYELDGGTVDGDNPTGYDVTDTINLIDPEQDGFTFTGWYLDSAKTQKLSRSGWDPGEVSGDVTLYAGWKSEKTLEQCNWEEISDISATGNPSKYFGIGDTKTVTLNNQEHTVRIIGFNHDTLTSDSTKTAGITFEFANVITESGGGVTSTNWNNTADNTNFPESTLNTLLNNPTDSIYTKLKAVTGDVIKQVKKGVGTSDDTTEETPYKLSTYDTYLFPLAHDEMADRDTYTVEGEGSKYQYYSEHTETADLVKTAVGSTAGQTYWDRSPRVTADYKVRAYCFNSSALRFNFDNANNPHCVAPAFCI